MTSPPWRSLPPERADEEVLGLANSESRLLLTNDKDFSELVYREGRVSAGIVLLRFQSRSGPEKAAHLSAILTRLADRLPGHFAVVSEERVRLRPIRRR